MAFDIIGAKQAGYNDSEIADFLGSKYGIDVGGARGAGYTDQEIIGKALSKYGAGTNDAATDMVSSHERGKRILPTESPVKNVVRESIPLAGATVGGILGSVAAPVAGTVAGGALGYGIGKAANRLIGLENDAPAVQTLAGNINLPQGRNSLERALLQSTGDIGTGLVNEMTGLALGASIGKAGDLAKKGYVSVKSAINPPIEKIVSDGIQRGIRPTVVGKRTAPQRQSYMNKARSAVEDIVDNKATLQYADDFGEVTASGRVPETLPEFAQAINQRKGAIFKQYDDMAQAAGLNGAKVDVAPIAKELDVIIKNKVLQDTQPGIVAHAREVQKSLLKRGSYTATEAQEAITTYNDILKSVYRGEGRQISPTANVDAVVASRLRGALDKAITSAEGEGYQALKNQYGALKTIERDVNNRAGVSSRMSPYGLFDVSNVWTAAQAVKSLLTGNILGTTEAAAAFATKRYMQKANKADTIIKNMFKRVEKARPNMGSQLPPEGFMPTGTATVNMPPEVEWSRSHTRVPTNLQPPAPAPMRERVPTNLQPPALNPRDQLTPIVGNQVGSFGTFTPEDAFAQMEQAFKRGDMKTYNFWAKIAEQKMQGPNTQSQAITNLLKLGALGTGAGAAGMTLSGLAPERR